MLKFYLPIWTTLSGQDITPCSPLKNYYSRWLPILLDTKDLDPHTLTVFSRLPQHIYIVQKQTIQQWEPTNYTGKHTPNRGLSYPLGNFYTLFREGMSIARIIITYSSALFKLLLNLKNYILHV